MNQVAKAELFRALHHASELLVLPNAWDAGSAVVFERAGFEAIGSTSAGIAYSLGYPDGEELPLDEMLAVQARIINRIEVPFSMDIERGFGPGVDRVLETVEKVVSGGAVGINLEDGLTDGGARLADADFQIELIREIDRLRTRVGVPIVINARSDSFWLRLGSAEEQLRESVERANAYLAAGADCAFVPGNLGRETIATLVMEIDGAVNVIAAPNTPPPMELEELGVARLSLGSGPARASLSTLKQLAGEVRRGSLAALVDIGLSYDEANSLFLRDEQVGDAEESR